MLDAAKFDVVNTINLYAMALDSRQWVLFDKVFTPDVTADFGGGASWSDLAAFKRDFEMIHTPFDATQHITSGHVVSIRADGARCLSYVHGFFMRAAADGGGLFESTGWYDDALVKTADGWRIKNRLCKMVRWSGNPKVMQMSPDMPFDPALSRLYVETSAGRVGFFGN
jgi:SnoaL-like domain